MMALSRIWNRYWFTPTTWTHLALGRIFFFYQLVRTSRGLDSWAWAVFSRAIWLPVSFFDKFGIPAFSAPVLRTCDALFYVSSFLASIGLFTRVSMATSATLALYLLGLPNDFGKISHGSNLAVIFCGFLALSRAGDRLSIDALIRRLRNRPLKSPEKSGEYTWPIRVAWLCVVIMYGSAGYAKETQTGIAWATSDNLRMLLLRHQYSHGVPTQLGVRLAAHPDLCHWFAGAAMATELFSPLALFHRYLRVVFGSGLCAMQIGIYLMMGILFDYPIYMILAFWIPWGSIVDFGFARLQRQATVARWTAALGA